MAPVRAATWRKAMTLLEYSARAVRIRSPDDFDDGAGAGGDLEEGDDVAGVFGPCGQDPVAG
jgi:hypothetical protein